MKRFKDAPHRIYLQFGDGTIEDGDSFRKFADEGDVTWCEDSINANDICYVRAGVKTPASRYAVAYIQKELPLMERQLEQASEGDGRNNRSERTFLSGAIQFAKKTLAHASKPKAETRQRAEQQRSKG